MVHGRKSPCNSSARSWWMERQTGFRDIEFTDLGANVGCSEFLTKACLDRNRLLRRWWWNTLLYKENRLGSSKVERYSKTIWRIKAGALVASIGFLVVSHVDFDAQINFSKKVFVDGDMLHNHTSKDQSLPRWSYTVLNHQIWRHWYSVTSLSSLLRRPLLRSNPHWGQTDSLFLSQLWNISAHTTDSVISALCLKVMLTETDSVQFFFLC